MQIKVKEIIKNGDRIEVKYEQEGLDNYFALKDNLFWEYGVDVSSVPDSIAIIPFVCDMLPMAFVLDATIIVDELDKDFYECIADYREGYKKVAPLLDYKGKVVANKLVKNDYKTDKDCVLFSGGIDATCTLVNNEANVSDCVTVWGADVKCDNEEGWKVLSQSLEDTIRKFGKNWYVIRTNFRSVINEKELTKYIKVTKDDWWHGYQHGVALLGCSAPLAYLKGYNTIHIASSFTEKYRAMCASDPYTDNCFRVGNSKAHHDGFEYDRCQKIQVISKAIEEKNISLNLHVCWKSSSGKNCGVCEKCVRSYLNCRAVGVDPSRLGIECNLPMEKVKSSYWFDYDYTKENVLGRIMMIKENITATYGDDCPEDLKWIVKLDPGFVSMTPYWLLKRAYRKIKSFANS